MAITVQNSAVSGWATVVGLAKETTFATAVAPSLYVPFQQANISVANKVITRTPVRRSKSEALPGYGLVEVTGSIDQMVDPDSIGLPLALCLGSDTVTSTAASGAKIHTIKLGAQSTSTISADYGKNSVAQYVGCKFSGVDLSCKPGSDLGAKFQFMGQTVALLASQSLTPSYTNTPFFEWSFIQPATIDNVTVDMADFNVSVKLNNKPMYTSTSGRFARSFNELGATVTGSFTYPYKDDTVNALLWGGNTGPIAGNAVGHTIVIPFTHPTMANGSVPYSFNITLNNVVLLDAPIPIQAKGEVMQQVKFQAAESVAGASDAITIALTSTALAAYV